jgi:glutamine---fructose-6-phosphate transaminase (isomerizing)
LTDESDRAYKRHSLKAVTETVFHTTLFLSYRSTPMTRFLNDILRQPSALASTIEFLGGAGRQTLDDAAAVLRQASHIYLTGIGSSYHAAVAAAATFNRGARPVYLQDAAELAHFAALPTGSVLVILSRSGESAEILKLLAAARENKAIVVGLTHAEDSSLARQAKIPLVVPVQFDHSISVNTYACLAATANILATTVVDAFRSTTRDELLRAIDSVSESISIWQQQIARTSWLSRGSSYYFLARGSSLATCHEARLLWEEGAKHPATSMGTASFRHGPQEIVSDGLRFGMWIDPERMRQEDFAVARDLKKLGASAMLIGYQVPEDAGDLVLQVPPTPRGWQFLLDVVPAQLAAAHLAEISEVDCDSFRICSYIVRGEYGLISEMAAPKERGK